MGPDSKGLRVSNVVNDFASDLDSATSFQNSLGVHHEETTVFYIQISMISNSVGSYSNHVRDFNTTPNKIFILTTIDTKTQFCYSLSDSEAQKSSFRQLLF